VALGAVFAQPAVEVSVRRPRRRGALARLDPPVLVAGLHRQSAPETIGQAAVELDADTAVRLVVEARIVQQIAALVVDVVDDAMRPRQHVSARPRVEPSEERHLGARAQSKAVPVPVLRDHPLVRRNGRNDAGEGRGRAEGHVTLVPELEAAERVDEAGMFARAPLDEAVPRVEIEVEQAGVVGVRARARDPSVVVGIIEVLVDQDALLDHAAADASQQHESPQHEVDVDLGDDAVHAAPSELGQSGAVRAVARRHPHTAADLQRRVGW